MFAHLVAQYRVGALDQQVTVGMASQRVGPPGGEHRRQLPAALFLFVDADDLHVVDVDPGTFTKPLPLRHGPSVRCDAVRIGDPVTLV